MATAHRRRIDPDPRFPKRSALRDLFPAGAHPGPDDQIVRTGAPFGLRKILRLRSQIALSPDLLPGCDGR